AVPLSPAGGKQSARCRLATRSKGTTSMRPHPHPGTPAFNPTSLHAIDGGWTRDNPVRGRTRPRRKRAGDIEPDLQFLIVAELEAVLRAIPNDIVRRQPAYTRRGRSGPAPPPPPDVLGPVLRVIILTA